MSTKPGWIDFRALCRSVDALKVLESYNVKLKIKGDQAQGFCPLPTHNGQRRSPSFSISLKKKCWQCFGCSAKGNLIDLVARLEGLDPSNGKDVRKAAEILQSKLGLNSHVPPANNAATTTRSGPMPDHGAARNSLPVRINAPLDFELKNLDYDHPYLASRGVLPETVREFGLGYCNRGMLAGRIVIPIHDEQVRLVGYAGRLIDDRSIDAENPKYKLPSARERDGTRFEFHKSRLLYNSHRIKGKVSDLIVVEGFPSTWWLAQHGYKNVVALMGSDCSEEQAKLILDKVEFDGRIWIMPDGNEAGVRCARNFLERFACCRFVRWVKLRKAEQPTDLNFVDLKTVLGV